MSGYHHDICVPGGTPQHSSLPGDGAFRQQLRRFPSVQIPDRDGDLVIVVQSIMLDERGHQRRRVDESASDARNNSQLPRAREFAPSQRKGARF